MKNRVTPGIIFTVYYGEYNDSLRWQEIIETEDINIIDGLKNWVNTCEAMVCHVKRLTLCEDKDMSILIDEDFGFVNRDGWKIIIPKELHFEEAGELALAIFEEKWDKVDEIITDNKLEVKDEGKK